MHLSARAKIAGLVAMAALIVLAVLLAYEKSGWDGEVYWQAAQSLAHGGDPYAEGIAGQRAYLDAAHRVPGQPAPMTYVYSPVTLPILRAAAALPAAAAGGGFFLLIAAGVLLQLRALWQLCGAAERPWFLLLMPLSIFFPGLLWNHVILSGNIAYLLYGLVFAAAVPGCRQNRWAGYYAAVFLASLCKSPLLTLLAFPVLVGRRQWWAAMATGGAGVAAFAAQSLLWPRLFAEYLTAVQLQFDWNDDFGCSPAGLLGHLLRIRAIAYDAPVKLFYLGFALLLFAALWWLSQRTYAASERVLWLAVAMVGSVLLNPRVKEYDVAAITLPMLLILLRAAGQLAVWLRARVAPVYGAALRPQPVAVLLGLACLLAVNGLAAGNAWLATECALLLLTVVAGGWALLRCSARADAR